MTDDRRRYAGDRGRQLRKVEAMPTAYVECRAMGHAWDIQGWGHIDQMPPDLVPPIVRDFRWSNVRVSACFRCGTLRDDFFPVARDRWTREQVQYRRYRYADGYRVEGGADRVVFAFALHERWTGDAMPD